ncbi:MAG TPA: FtsX-like permease family protein [Bacteroidales bacterium]|nr:FtsX-like permease family protein [Bacteroidales bacterium]
MNNFTMAWRNLWRNKRRTLITVASVFFAIFFALVMRSLQLGTYNHMYKNVIEQYTGYLQVQHQDFWDSKTIDNIIQPTPELEQTIFDDPNTTTIVPRFESFALISSGPLTKGVMVLGIDPEKESLLSDVRSKLIKYRITEENIKTLKQELPEKYRSNLELNKGRSYSNNSYLLLELGVEDADSSNVLGVFRKYASFTNGYIQKSEPGVLIGDRLSIFLNASIGDTLVLIGQGYQGTTAAGKYRINGIVRMPTPDFDSRIVYLPVDICQELYNAPGMLTSMAVAVKSSDDDEINRMIRSLGSKLESPLRVIGWREMNELMINQMDADSKSGSIMIAILYLVIAFGIFGTVLMMTAERRREFGVLVAIGMQKTKLASVMALEMIYIGIIGVTSGAIAALPVIYYGYYNPIRFTGEMGKMYENYGMEPVMPMLLPDNYFLWQAFVIAVIVMIAIIYPVKKIMKMKVVSSLKA